MEKKNLKDYIGKTLYYLDEDKTIKPFTVEFVNNDSALSIIDGECFTKDFKDLYETEEEARIKSAGKIVAFCREVDKNTGDIAYYIVCDDVAKDPSLIHILSIRSRFNHELTYYVAKSDNINEEILKTMDDDLINDMKEYDAVIEIDEIFNKTVKGR